MKIIGTSPETIDLAEDRDRFRQMMAQLGIPMPESGMATSLEEALEVAARIGYPLMVRPSYVLGGRGMEIVHDEDMLRPVCGRRGGRDAGAADPHRQVPGERDRVRGRRHLRRHRRLRARGHGAHRVCGRPFGRLRLRHPAGQHPAEHLETIERYTRTIATELNVVGLMNIQYAIANDTVYVLEANPRASRTVPLVSKVCDIQMARMATQVMLGAKLADLDPQRRPIPHFGVKEAVFPFNMFPEVDPLLGPEMRSTGEVLGLASSFGLAYFKAQEAAQQRLPLEGTVLITVAERDRANVLEAARGFAELGFKIRATAGTHAFLAANGIASDPILKLHEGRPNIADAITNGEIHLVINTPAGKSSEFDDSYIRKAAIRHKVPYLTTPAAALAAAGGIAAHRASRDGVRSLQSYHAGIAGRGLRAEHAEVQRGERTPVRTRSRNLVQSVPAWIGTPYFSWSVHTLP